MGSKLSTGSIRFFLFADGLADLLQLETDGGHGVTTSPEILPREAPLLAAPSGYGDSALPLEKPAHRSPCRCSGIVARNAQGSWRKMC